MEEIDRQFDEQTAEEKLEQEKLMEQYKAQLESQGTQKGNMGLTGGSSTPISQPVPTTEQLQINDSSYSGFITGGSIAMLTIIVVASYVYIKRNFVRKPKEK